MEGSDAGESYSISGSDVSAWGGDEKVGGWKDLGSMGEGGEIMVAGGWRSLGRARGDGGWEELWVNSVGMAVVAIKEKLQADSESADVHFSASLTSKIWW